MKILVLHDSNYGNTKKVAETIAAELGAESLSIDSVRPDTLNDFDLIIVGTPIVGWRPTENMQPFLSKLPNLTGVKATTFDTRVKLFIHGDAMNKMARSLQKAGADIITKPMAFYVAGPQQVPYLVDGELEKAQKWAREIKRLLAIK